MSTKWTVRLSALVALVFLGLAAMKMPSALILLPAIALGVWQHERERDDDALVRHAWPLALLAVLALGGVGASVYMTRHHEVELYGSEELQAEALVGCEESEGVSCDIVNTSDWSELFTVPLFTWAVPTYLLLALLAVLALRGRHELKPIMLLAGVGAVVFSGFLYWISVTQLGAVCLWCMRLYVLNALIPFLVLASGYDPGEDGFEPSSVGMPLFAFLVLATLSVGAQRSYRASLLEVTEGEVAARELPALEEVAESADDPQGPPPVLTFNVTTEDGNQATIGTTPEDAWKGSPDAKVAIIEFADFECGYCKRAGFQLRRLYEAYKDDVVFVYKHFPMDPECNPGVNNKKHRYACLAHSASVCAQQQGRFWAYHDLLYKNNHQLASEHLVAYAEKVGLDMDVWRGCMQRREGDARVRAAAEEGKRADTHGTPRIWINGQLYRSGASAEQMARAIEAALGNTGSDALQRAAALADDRVDLAPIPADVPEMQHIRHGNLDFWIDTFEAALENGKAVSRKGEIPGTRMSWFAAKDACEAAGKRICSEQEWIAACQAAAPIDDDDDGQFADDLIEGNAYPYGDFHTPGLCWEDHESQSRDPAAVPWRPVYTGEMPGCRTPDGVYDMAGNMEEWVGTTPETAVLLGGAFDTPDDKARCYRRNDTFGAGYANMRTGFRCCRSE